MESSFTVIFPPHTGNNAVLFVSRGASDVGWRWGDRWCLPCLDTEVISRADSLMCVVASSSVMYSCTVCSTTLNTAYLTVWEKWVMWCPVVLVQAMLYHVYFAPAHTTTFSKCLFSHRTQCTQTAIKHALTQSCTNLHWKWPLTPYLCLTDCKITRHYRSWRKAFNISEMPLGFW